MKTRVNFCLELQEQKINARGTAPLYYRITVAGGYVYLATGVAIAPEDWDKQAKRVLGKTPAARAANASLVKMLDSLTDFHADLERLKKPVTAAAIKRLYRRNGATTSLLELCELYQAHRKALVGIEIGAAVVRNDAAATGGLRAFLTATKRLEMRPEEFTAGMAEQFTHWLLTAKGAGRSTANKYVGMVTAVLKWGVRYGHLDNNPCVGLKSKSDAVKDIVYLSAGEIARLATAPQATKRLSQARDCFIFQCWTGLAYADLAALNVAESVETDSNGRRFLRIRRAKSTLFRGYECIIPLMPEAERILALYGEKLPVYERTYYNKLLKKLGEPLGLGVDKMKSHTGRKTAATLMLNLGIPIGVVSKFLGHSTSKLTERLYAKLLDTTVVDAFSVLFGAPTPLPSTAGLLAELDTCAGRVVPMFRAANRMGA